MRRHRGLRLGALSTALAAVASVLSLATASAVTDAGYPPLAAAVVADAPAREIRSIYPSEWGAPRPDGVAIAPDGSSTLVVGDDQRLVQITPTEELVGTLEVPAGVDVRDVGIDPASGRFVIESTDELVWGRISSTTSTRSDTLDDLGLVTPAGMTFDAAGNLLTLDAASETIVNLGRPTTALDTTPVVTPLPSGVGFATEGLAYNPADGLVYVTNVARDKLYGVDAQGAIHAAHDLSGLGIHDLTGMSFGPSSDPTDDPSTTNLFVADAGDATTFGRVAEVTLAAPQALAAPAVNATLVKQTNTSTWSPASPDPAGVTYLGAQLSQPGLRDRLLIADSEVDETTGAGYHGVNLWETTRPGVVQQTGTTVGWTPEPTGLGFDPQTATLFVSTDSGQRIHMVKQGPDNRFGSGDDVRTMLGTAQYGLGDTEDPAFDTAGRHLFFVDGVSREVYDLNPVNGTIGDGNDIVTHFDVGQYGAGDTEGLAYNPNTDTLYVGDRSNGTIYEVTKAGALVRTIDVNGIAALNHVSGLGVGPSSDNASLTSIYIVDRAVDNGSSASENDGKMFEIRAPGGAPPANTPPTVDAGPNRTITMPNAAMLDGTVTDDGNPIPPGTTTMAWSKDSGPGNVTFGSPNAADTAATFSAAGSYVLRLTANDSTGPVSDTVSVTVNPSGPTPGVLDIPVAVGSDDAEQAGSGSVDLASQNLQLVNANGSAQTVGLRFANVALPPDATITNAQVRFVVEASSSTATNLTIRAQAHDNPPSFTTATNDISSRTTIGNVSWSNVPAWTTVGATQQTPNLASLIQALVDRPGWAENNAIVLIITGTGRRNAESLEGGFAPVLHVEFGPPVNTQPSVDAGPNQTITFPNTASLDGTVTDDGQPAPPATTTTTWSKQSGPGTVTFGNAAHVDTTATFSEPGTYVLRLTADDSTGPVFDDITITVQPPPNTPPVVDAGADQTINLPSSATLDGTVTDDGLPAPPSLTTTWSKVSGPGTVTFNNASAVDTTATFSAAGTYVLRLSANDGAMSASDEVTIRALSAGNTAPTVGAGPDQSITLPATANLDGTVGDDGVPVAATRQWTKQSGPGTVIFGNANAEDTTATFSTDGVYVLRLTANDTEAQASDEVQITVEPPTPTSGTIDVPIATGSDDAEEESGGVMRLTRVNLRLVNVSGVPQTVGLRFANLALPRNANITSAYVAFRADSTGSTATNLTIRAQDHDNPPTFTTAASDISSRPTIATSVQWNPVPSWNTVGAVEQTPSLVPLVQAMVNRPGWAQNNAIVLIITGAGRRMAESLEAGTTLAPVLHVEFGPPVNQAPSVDAGTDQTINQVSTNLDGTVTDDGLPAPPSLTTAWSKVSGPGTVTFGNAAHVDTTATFSEPGTYVLRLTANDSTGPVFDEVTIRVLTAGNTAPSVDAGTDQTITLPTDTASLDATVSDDGIPSAATLQWTKQSGPGTVNFVSPNAEDTSATFSAAGTYVLRLTADDTEAQASDEVQVTVEPATPTSTTIDVPIATGSDDAEQANTGTMSLARANLRIVNVSGTPQTVGLRFTNLPMPRNATITDAYVEFRADSTATAAANITIRAQDHDDPPTFTTAANDLTSRPTVGGVTWSPGSWNSIGAPEQTSNLSSLIQLIVNRSGWNPNQAIVLIFTGTGRRVAESFEAGATLRPVLHVQYQTP